MNETPRTVTTVEELEVAALAHIDFAWADARRRAKDAGWNRPGDIGDRGVHGDGFKQGVKAVLRALPATALSPAPALAAGPGQIIMDIPEPGCVTHACPPEGKGVMPCCGRTPFEVPRTDRITIHEGFVTCHAAPAVTAGQVVAR